MHDKWMLAGRSRHQAAVGTRFLTGGSTLVNGQAKEEKIKPFDAERQVLKNLKDRPRPLCIVRNYV